MNLRTPPPLVRRTALVLARLAGLAALYVVAARLGLQYDQVQENQRVLWPQAGVATGGLLLLGMRYWPAVMVGSLYVSRTTALPEGGAMDMSLAAGLALGNTLGPLAAAAMLNKWGQFRPTLERVRDVNLFLLFAVVLAPAVSATIAVGAAVPQVAHSMEQLHGPGTQQLLGLWWWRRWFGHGISDLLVAPVLLTWARRPSLGWRRPTRWAEVALLVSSLLAVCLAAFTQRRVFGLINYPASYAPFPFVIWAALRFGQRGTALTTFLVSTAAVVGASQGHGPFGGVDGPQSLILLQVYLTALALSGLYLAAAVAERVVAEQKLRASHEELRALSASLQSAREEERTLIAREIHDELGQQLTGLKMVLHLLLRKLPQDQPSLTARGAELSDMIDGAVQAVRKIASDLRPGILDDLGIVASMQWQVTEFHSRTGINAHFAPPGDDLVLDSARSTTLFRILQEALTNVARHAQASRVDVALRRQNTGIVLEVRDDGRGIPEAVESGGRTLGLVGMRERVQLLGGTLTVTSGVGIGSRHGTLVQAFIPLAPE